MMTSALHADVTTSSINFDNGRQIGKAKAAIHRLIFKQRARRRELGCSSMISGTILAAHTKMLAGTVTALAGWGCVMILRLVTNPAAAGVDATRLPQAVARSGHSSMTEIVMRKRIRFGSMSR